jgi:hypothetical protein
MTNLQKGLILAAAQMALVASLAAKYAVDRERLPRVWVPTVAYDPSLPIRGRYMRVRLCLAAEDVDVSSGHFRGVMHDVTLNVRDGHLVATAADHPTGLHVTSQWAINRGPQVTVLMEPVAFFLTEHVMDPSIRRPGEELWMEVSVPKTGPPRPIQLAIKHDGSFTPLGLR